MLPSMPLISTPFKEQVLDNVEGASTSEQNTDNELESTCPTLQDQTLITGQQKLDIAEQRQSPTKALDLSTTSSVSSKKSSPLKHVTPILKKYNSQRKSKSTKKVALLNKNSQQQQVDSEKPTLRAIAPKPVVVLVTPQQQDASSQLAENAAVSSVGTPAEAKDEKSTSGSASERKDNEDELAALMLASTTICTTKSRSSNVMRKKSKQMRNMQATLALLAPDPPSVREEKSHGFAQAYYMKVRERLEGTELLNEFLDTMNDFGNKILDVSDLYWKVTSVLSQHQDLCEEFLAFLLPEQAMQIGKFMEHLMVTKMKDFFRKLEIYFAKQPQQMQKIYTSLMALGNQANVTIEDVRSIMLPLLKGNSLLVDTFLSLLPEERPPDSCMTEFEDMECADMESDHSGEDELFETVQVPDQEDAYGGDTCACVCHDSRDDKYRVRAQHCVKCGTRFIHGKVFLQTGKVLRPAKVIFQNESSNESIQRLTPKAQPRSRSRKKGGEACSINNFSPVKQGNNSISSDDHRIDQEEDDATALKSKNMSPKSARGSKARSSNAANKARDRTTGAKASTKNSPNEKKETLNSRPAAKSGSVRQSRAASSSCNKQITFISQPVVSLRDIGSDITPSMLCKNSARCNTTTSKCGTKSSPVESSTTVINHPLDVTLEDNPEKIKDAEILQDEYPQENMECSISYLTPEVKMETDELDSGVEEGRSTSWTREEDKTILQMFQLDCSTEQAFVKISEHLPQRSLNEIQSRFQTLMKLLQQMTGAKMEEDVSSPH